MINGEKKRWVKYCARGRIHKTFFSSQLANGTSKLECLSLAAFCESDVKGTSPCGLYYKHIMIVNDDSRVVSK